MLCGILYGFKKGIELNVETILKLKKFIMQITILGSTGQVGKVVINEALKLGYQVKVLARDPEKLGELKEKVEIVKGDLLDELSVGKALEGSKAVINVSGAVKEP